MLYSILSHLFPTKGIIKTPQRIVFIRPCCIGDVVMATGALSALRQTYPEAHITWAVGSWSARTVEYHPALDAILDTGRGDLPVRSVGEMMRFVLQLRDGQFDMAVSLVRSPLMSLAVSLSGIPVRVGLDSDGRGFGYNVRVRIQPDSIEHEGAIYLKVIQKIAGHPIHAFANLPVLDSALSSIQTRLITEKITTPFIIAHPGGGSNPGMQMDSKRYPLAQLADMLNQVADHLSASIILIGGPKDGDLVERVSRKLTVEHVSWVGELSFPEIGALAESALFYIGNDTGLTHVASASGARTVMMMGPSDPKRYAPFTPNHLVLWKSIKLQSGGVASAHQQDWDWSRDGFTVEAGVEKIIEFIESRERKGQDNAYPHSFD